MRNCMLIHRGGAMRQWGEMRRPNLGRNFKNRKSPILHFYMRTSVWADSSWSFQGQHKIRSRVGLQKLHRLFPTSISWIFCGKGYPSACDHTFSLFSEEDVIVGLTSQRWWYGTIGSTFGKEFAKPPHYITVVSTCFASCLLYGVEFIDQVRNLLSCMNRRLLRQAAIIRKFQYESLQWRISSFHYSTVQSTSCKC
jgi:hypothetical protein